MEDRFSTSLLNTVDEVLHKVKVDQERAREGLKSFYESSESNVEHQIIGPIIVALGWDLTHPEEVTTKYWNIPENTGDKPDFVLYERGRPVIVIEAKALGKTGGPDNLIQVLRYLRHCPSVLLTDGIVWSYYDESSARISNDSYDLDEIIQEPKFRRAVTEIVKPEWEFDLFKHNREFCLILLESLERMWSGRIDGPSYRTKIRDAKYEADKMLYSHIEDALRDLVNDLDIIKLVESHLKQKIVKHIKEKLDHELDYQRMKPALRMNFFENLVRQYILEKLQSEVDDE